ncbi:MAG: efflux RND transporter periplasmic adaptor subunit [Planctomycetes bacterium]|nr:efflux RND transporter periplasmic adaptor subunit [Planctomycetota bacterium]
MKTIIVIMIVGALGGGGTLLYRSASDSTSQSSVPDGLLHTAGRGKLTVVITENGTLMAKNSEKITCKAKGGGTITELIEEGTSVEEGEVLCRLDTTDLEQEQQKLELDIVKTEADLDTAKTELEIQESDNVATVAKARITLTKAENQLERYKDGDAPKERRTLKIAIKEAEIRHSRAEKKYADSKMLYEKDYINKSQLEQDDIDFERAKIELEGANRDLEICDKYTYPMTMTDKELALSDAKRGLDNSEKRAKSTLRQKEVAVESNEARLVSLTSKLEKVKENIEYLTLKAPQPGIVIYGDPSAPWYRQNIKVGGRIWSGITVFTIPDLRVMQVQVKIHEADINKLEEEQTATVTMDTYPGLLLKGKVTKIATIAGGTDPWSGNDDEVKRFTVDVTLDSTDGETLKPGISAKVEIFIAEHEDVLFIPLQCIYAEEGVYYAHVLGDDGKPTRVEVKPGASNDSYWQILEGIEEGDRVLLYSPALAAAAGKIEESEEGQAAASPATMPMQNGGG